MLFYCIQTLIATHKSTITVLSTDPSTCANSVRTQNVFGTRYMISTCELLTKGFYIHNYDTRFTLNGYSHEVAPAHATKKSQAVSAVHGSTSIIGDHDDSIA
jgi:hypothetical protein